MATDDERRRVAAELRGLNGNVSHVRRVYEDEGSSILCDDQADYYQICHAVAGYLPAEHMHPCDYEELHARLADLIEPSCDREALLALADEIEDIESVMGCVNAANGGWLFVAHRHNDIANRIREACGEAGR